MTLEEIKSEIRRLIRGIEESVSWFVGDEFTLGEYYTYDKCLKMLEDIEQTSMDEVIKALGDGIGVPADYCGSEAKSYVIGYRKALFDIGENWNKGGNK